MTDKIVPLAPSFDVKPSGEPVPVRHLVLVMHGIYSISDRWIKLERTFKGRFADIALTPKPISYSIVGIRSLFTRRRAQERATLVANRIELALKSNDYDYVSLHCHSNGTKVFSDLPADVQSKFDWVFFAGSICHMDDDQKFSCEQIVNDCGIYDIFPILAASLRPGTFGHTGVIGFHNPPVTDRFFEYRHSEATSVGHFERAVLPILRTGTVQQAGLRTVPRLQLYGPKIIQAMVAGLGLGAGLIWWL